jgi:hypothetical protein
MDGLIMGHNTLEQNRWSATGINPLTNIRPTKVKLDSYTPPAENNGAQAPKKDESWLSGIFKWLSE